MVQTNFISPYQALPSTLATNGEYLFWHPEWIKIRDCLMGEIMVKRRKTYYLPRKGAQTDEEYEAYLRSAVFYNATKRTVDGLVGAVHYRPAMVDDLPEKMSLTSITNDGQSYETFQKRITREICSVGRYGVLVDAPADGGEPYLTGYQAEDIIDWGTSRVGSKETVDMVLLREFVRKRSPIGLPTETVEALRLLYLDDEGIYKQRYYPDGNITSDNYTEFTPLKRGRPLRSIPFEFINPYDFGVDVEKPPILDIVGLNLSHYISYADLEMGRAYTATPIWTVSMQGGKDDDAEFVIGPNTIWQVGINEKVDLIEFSGSGLKFLENALLQKEQEISSLGGRLNGVSRGAAAESSESVIARERGESSFLQSIVATMSECGTRLLNMLADWKGLDANITVRLSNEGTEMYLDAREIRAIESLYKTGLLPVEVIYAVFRDASILPSEMSLAEFKELLPSMMPQTESKIAEYQAKAKIDAKYEQQAAELQAKLQPPTYASYPRDGNVSTSTTAAKPKRGNVKRPATKPAA